AHFTRTFSASIPAFIITLRPPPTSTLFPYTTLFRSRSPALYGRCSRRLGRSLLRLFQRSRRQAGTVSELWMRSSRSLRLRRLMRSEEHTSELQSRFDLVCRLLLEKKKKATHYYSLTHLFIFMIQHISSSSTTIIHFSTHPTRVPTISFNATNLCRICLSL